jgi:ABC-type antimicrobial peptide transport system permease subunit
VPVANENEFTLLQNAISRNPKILSTAGTQQQLGAGEASGVKVSYSQNEQEAQLLHIGDHYLATVGVKLLEGRLFKVRQESDYTKAVIVNQTFARQYSLERPIGAQLLLDSQYVNIVGVVQDHKEYGNHGRIPPMIFRVVKPAAYRYLNIKARPEDLKEVRAYVQAEWQKVIPTVPFQGFFQQELREKETLMNNGLQSICLVLAGLIMLLSAVGLYGLVSLNMLKRLKEIGIRKVLGASVIQIIGLVNREFIKIMLLAFGIGSAIGYVFVSKVVFTVMYTYHTEMSIWPFVITLLTLAGGAALTIGHKVYRAASLNPSVILQNE